MDTFCFVLISVFAWISTVDSLQCYRCQSNQPGCGKELNIRLQRWYTCPDTGEGGGENFCVKVITKVGSDQEYIRECLTTLRHNTGHREKLPTVQRHGYCEPARNDDPYDPNNNDIQYCFCNDWNGCNTASGINSSYSASLLLASAVALWLRFRS